jgi:hypothetical protein
MEMDEPWMRDGVATPVPPLVRGRGDVSTALFAKIDPETISVPAVVVVAASEVIVAVGATRPLAVTVPTNVGLGTTEIFGCWPPVDESGLEAVTAVTKPPLEPEAKPPENGKSTRVNPLI